MTWAGLRAGVFSLSHYKGYLRDIGDMLIAAQARIPRTCSSVAADVPASATRRVLIVHWRAKQVMHCGFAVQLEGKMGQKMGMGD